MIALYNLDAILAVGYLHALVEGFVTSHEIDSSEMLRRLYVLRVRLPIIKL